MSYINPIPIMRRGHDTPEMSRIYAMMLKFIKFPCKYFQLWDVRPNCGYFFTGSHWYGADQNQMAFITAFMSKYGDFDEELAGITREEIRDMCIKTIRYSCFTHDTGPEDCVRVMGRNKLQSGTKWGGNYVPWPGPRNKFFQSSQVGGSITSLGFAVWIMWEDLDEETRQMAYNAITDYAERWVNYEPRDGVYYNTQAEENGWTAMGLFTAACLFRDDPRAPAWRESAICWLLDSGMTPLDRVSSRVLSDGKPIGSKVGHITIQPDFTAENHGIVHPDYLGAPLAYRAQFILFSKLAGDTGEIPGIFINWDNIYNKVFKVCASADGGVVPIQSQDWWYYRIGMLNIHIATKLLFDDRHAALLEKKCLHVLETTQAGHDNGTFIDNEPDKCIVSNDFQTLTDMEPSFCSALAVAWLWYMVGGEGVTPVNCEEYEADICRVKHYPHGGTVLQRTKDAFNAFSYRNSAIAFSLPEDKLWTITVPPCSTFGAMKFKDDCSEDYGLSNQDTIRYVENLRVYDDIETFAAAASINRGLGKARQDVAFVSLPDGVAVYFSRVKAVKDCSIESYTSGLTGVRNEYYKLMPEFAKGYRNIYVDDREPVKMEGYIGGEDIITDFGKARFVAIDDKISYILHGGNNVRYISHHHYPKWKGIEDFLVLNYMENVEMKAGDELPLYVQVCLPNENIEKAREKRLYVSCGGNTDGVILGGRFIFSSLLPSEGLSETSFRIEAGEVPLFEGSVSFRDGIYTHSQTLPVRGCGVRTALAKVKTDRNFDAVVLPCGNTLIRFEGENTYHSL